jgi:predicted acylesterase/phospholipase RssA
MNQPAQTTGPVNTPPPNRFCDVVMKGGITSGVVYPLAVARLAERFKLKNIGGTSAGAIAAAAAAAAEFGRDKGGFDLLKKLPGFLSDAAPDAQNTNLFAFFQPQKGTRRLFNVLVAALDASSLSHGIQCVLCALICQYWWASLLGGLLGLFLIGLAWHANAGLLTGVNLLLGLALSLVGAILFPAIEFILEFSKSVPENFYGLCTGMSEAFYDIEKCVPPLCGQPLTFWLTEYLNRAAGRTTEEPLLSFGDLWGTKDPTAERQINLEMVTTCVTHGRPYRLPFRDDEDLNENRFYFCAEEFKLLFPKRVVDWLLSHPRPPTGKSAHDRAESIANREKLAKRGIFPMPAPADLPVVVAVRMSLSFPILLSAIPLYAVERRRDKSGENPEHCWFSDGGVCSNFPLHFFDSALPRRPTLSINLAEKPNGTPVDELQPVMPDNNEAGKQERWNRFELNESIESGTTIVREKSGFGKLTGFIGALMKTMQNWTDNTQSRLPGFRDRIVHVPLTPEEGGLNLNMPKSRIEALTGRGNQAGETLLNHFADSPNHPDMTWDNHRWLRMRAMMASLEKLVEQADNACAHPEGGDVPYDQWIESGFEGRSYKWANNTQRDVARRTLSALRGIARDWKEATTTQGNPVSAADNAPRPRAELRPRPQV